MTHHTRNPVTGRNGRNNVVYDMASQDKRPAWNQAKTLNHVSTIPPPPTFTSRSASPKNPEQPKIVYVQAPPHQLLSEPTFVSQELPRSRTNFEYPPLSNAQPKVVYVQPSTTPPQQNIILQDPHRPEAYPVDYKRPERPQIVYSQAPPVPQTQPPATHPRQPMIILQELPRSPADRKPKNGPRVVYVTPTPRPSQSAHRKRNPEPKPVERTPTVYHIQEPTQPPSHAPHRQQKPQQQQPVIIYQERSPPPSYRSNNEGVVRSLKYPVGI